jgi:hypothetical protein
MRHSFYVVTATATPHSSLYRASCNVDPNRQSATAPIACPENCRNSAQTQLLRARAKPTEAVHLTLARESKAPRDRASTQSPLPVRTTHPQSAALAEYSLTPFGRYEARGPRAPPRRRHPLTPDIVDSAGDAGSLCCWQAAARLATE